MPEFRDANPEDYEFRGDGKIVRKDRWETAIHKIRRRLIDAGLMEHAREFEIPEVIEAVEKLIEKKQAPPDDELDEAD